MNVNHAANIQVPVLSQNLWAARQRALESIYKPWFPQVVLDPNDYTLKGRLIQVYSHLYNGCAAISNLICRVASVCLNALRHVPGVNQLNAGVYAVYDYILPVNQINGLRGLNFCPRGLEKALGDGVFAPRYLRGLFQTQHLVSNSLEYITNFNERILNALKNNPINAPLLNPQGQVEFNYRVFSAQSNVCNAFALPGGSMVVNSQIIEELAQAVSNTQNMAISGAIRTVNVTRHDGSVARVDVSAVTLEDVTAALIGHEMTHAASRHALASMSFGFICSAVYRSFMHLMLFMSKQTDQAYQEAYSNRFIDPAAFRQQQRRYELRAEIIDATDQGIRFFFDKYRSRKNEHEADVTGAYFAINSGFNPLGALYLQEFFARKHFMPDYASFLSTHPSSENRKTVVYEFLQNLPRR